MAKKKTKIEYVFITNVWYKGKQYKEGTIFPGNELDRRKVSDLVADTDKYKEIYEKSIDATRTDKARLKRAYETIRILTAENLVLKTKLKMKIKK